jgi:GrpB-like predicted nucleotidyltransferase (UPF0157 family)
VTRPQIVGYDDRWPAEFRALESELRAALGDLARRIDHIGSTAVPGLAAKDVIDVQVAVSVLDLEALVDAFARAGYEHVAGNDRDHRPPGAEGPAGDWAKAFFRPPATSRRVNVHVRVDEAPNMRYALLFRDYLRAHVRAAAAYGKLKRKLAALEPPLDTGAYADLKDPACDIVIAAAEDWATATGWEP